MIKYSIMWQLQLAFQIQTLDSQSKEKLTGIVHEDK